MVVRNFHVVVHRADVSELGIIVSYVDVLDVDHLVVEIMLLNAKVPKILVVDYFIEGSIVLDFVDNDVRYLVLHVLDKVDIANNVDFCMLGEEPNILQNILGKIVRNKDE